jgi:hypothetical protein
LNRLKLSLGRVAVFLGGMMACQPSSQKQFVVSGTLRNAGGTTVLLAELPFNEHTRLVTDSARLDSSGQFALSTPAQPECFYQLFVKDGPGFLLINDALNIAVNADARQPERYAVSGSAASASIQRFDRQMQERYQAWRLATALADSVGAIKQEPDSLKQVFRVSAANAKQAIDALLTTAIERETNGTAQFYMLGYAKAVATDTVWQALANGALAKHPRHAGLLALRKR